MSSMIANAQAVTFPFAEALPAAASLWGVATQITEHTNPTRQAAAKIASEQFQGVYAQQFVTRMSTSSSSSGNVAVDLQQEAMNIANAWADASHQQQIYIYYAMVQASKNAHEGGIGGWIHTHILGDDTNYGSPPSAPANPAPPSFGATSVPQAYCPSFHGELNVGNACVAVG